MMSSSTRAMWAPGNGASTGCAGVVWSCPMFSPGGCGRFRFANYPLFARTGQEDSLQLPVACRLPVERDDTMGTMRNAMLLLLLVVVPRAAATELPLAILEPTGVKRSGWPVTSGIPLPQGALRDQELSALFDANGRELPLQT